MPQVTDNRSSSQNSCLLLLTTHDTNLLWLFHHILEVLAEVHYGRETILMHDDSCWRPRLSMLQTWLQDETHQTYTVTFRVCNYERKINTTAFNKCLWYWPSWKSRPATVLMHISLTMSQVRWFWLWLHEFLSHSGLSNPRDSLILQS